MKIVLNFALLTIAFWFIITGFRQLTKRQKWRLTKSVGLSIICSVLSVIVLTTIVVLF